MKLMDLLNEGEEKRPLSNEVKKHFLEIVSTYNKYQEMMDRKSDIAEIAETLGGITEAAKTLAIHEGDDWFDKHTIKRNMSELDKLGKAFDKCAVEAKSLDQRLNGLYEDMGHILSRYYKMGEISEEQMRERLGMNESVNEETHQVQLSPKGNHIVNIKEEDDDELQEDGTMQSGEKDPCWKGYEMVGKKMKDGKEVPNCVPKNESVNESASKEAMGIAALTGTRGSAVQDFIDKNRINSRKLFNALKKANLQGRINFAAALSGKPGNSNEKLTIKLFGEDKGEVEKIVKQVGKNEIKFYDALSKVEKRLGSKYPKFLDTALKQLKQNPSSFKTTAEKEEKLFQLVK